MSEERDPELKKFWENPVYKDPQKFLDTINEYVEIFNSAQVALPKSKKSEKFLKLLRSKGFKVEKMELEKDKIGEKLLGNLSQKFTYWVVTG